jgi:hypothetical protein
MVTLVVLLATLACMCGAFYLVTKEENIANDSLLKIFLLSVIFIGVLAVGVKSGIINNDSLVSLFSMYKEAAR